MNPRYPEVALQARHRCEYCHAPEAVFNFLFEVEHIVPIAGDGDDSDGNLALACRSCNLRKGSHVTGLDAETGETSALFHPRRDRWDEHFRFDPETGAVSGFTAVAHPTAVRLDMNSAPQREARRHWGRLGLFP